ncbi:ATP-binding protein [Phanerochaete sordida]|uniref:ATP-binding protein n=1 Tax=Phanerochaete sordida TaxID=48140 RepID=A0A9P3LI63_9APHY|nr:ATP-binding protein [Phanerochaete sordida]
MSSFASLLTSQFNAPLPLPQLNIVKALKAQHPQSQHLTVLTCWDGQFPLSAYLATIDITPSIVETETHCTVNYNADNKTLYDNVFAGVSEFTYDATAFRVFKAAWSESRMHYYLYHIVFAGADDKVGRKLMKAVYDWANDLKDEIWVFEGGQWEKNKKLFKAVQSAHWDDVVLDAKFKDGLRRDTKTFFASKRAYESLSVTWKRGILLLGPPGNGKTESIKALLKETTGVSPLYVKSFTTRMGPEQGIRAIFEHARSHTPCILILEDLDSMLVPEARSYFLNELDGLADNEGILTVATTNHPERIDDAILNRPSRFDVKYNFTLPDTTLRTAFALKWLAKVNALSAETGASFAKPDEMADAIAAKTEGWSYAFLKELFVSFLLRMAHDASLRETGAEVPENESVEALLLTQVDQLANQIIKTKEDDAAAPPKSARDGGVMYGRAVPMMHMGGVPIVPAGGGPAF